MNAAPAKKKLVIFPQGGLGNRIRALNSGIQLSKKLPVQLYICWLKDEGFNCDYEQIFEISDDFKFINFKKRNILFLKLMNRLTAKFPGLLKSINLFPNHYFNINVNDRISFQNKDTFIWTCGKFQEYPKIDLQFNKQIIERVSSICRDFDDKTFGIHIRLTDNTQAVNNSSPALFENKISEILAYEKDAKFFLCTDDPRIKNEFSERFGKAIITRDANLNRNAVEGIIDAAIDLLCLSKTKRIYSSYYTSFSEVASEFSSSERIVLKN